jgi:hypothetical protein
MLILIIIFADKNKVESFNLMDNINPYNQMHGPLQIHAHNHTHKYTHKPEPNLWYPNTLITKYFNSPYPHNYLNYYMDNYPSQYIGKYPYYHHVFNSVSPKTYYSKFNK